MATPIRVKHSVGGANNVVNRLTDQVSEYLTNLYNNPRKAGSLGLLYKLEMKAFMIYQEMK